jgi:aspartyl-tRNA(Asn)/glutamyl-tRNA(Gln) amidotransferase subunit B
MSYEAVIGLEIHAQLLTETKIFCGCSTKFGSEPNTQICPVCSGMPGVLPVMNRKAIEYVIKTGIALNCAVSRYSRFARKNYFYPDLPKGYQISQFELPLCEGGFVEINVNGDQRKICLTRIHLEEDAGKNIHEGSGNTSLVDLNRAGIPLMEIVTEPEIKSPVEAVEFMKSLRAIVRYIGVCGGNMEQGALRCDANISVRPAGDKELGVKTEIKNLNSFKFVEKALDYEIRRQGKAIKEGERIIQESRLWNTEKGITESMRSKEEAHDYRYFPEPDLVPVTVDELWIKEIKENIAELPDVKKARFVDQFKLPESDADFLVADRSTAEWFEESVELGGNPKTVANWIMGELMRLLNEDGITIDNCNLKPSHLIDLLNTIDKGTINIKQAKTVFEEMFNRSKGITVAVPAGKINIEAITPEVIIREKGLTQISDEGAIEAIVDDVLMKNPEEIERFRAGEEKLIGFFVGQVMKSTKGKANPKIINELLRKKLI